jgi:hypothetical protein
MIQSSGHTRALKTCNVDPCKSRSLVRLQELKEGEPLMTMLAKATYPVFHMFIPDPRPLRNFHVCLITSVAAPIHAHLENDAPTPSAEKTCSQGKPGVSKAPEANPIVNKNLQPLLMQPL